MPGNLLKTNGGTAVILGMSLPGDRTTVYNLSVEGHSNYFIEERGVWVHNVGPLDCFSGFSAQWQKHGPHMAHQLQMKAKNTPNGPPQGVFDAAPEDVASWLASQLEPGKQFNGSIPAPPGMARVFMPGTGEEAAANQLRVIWDGNRLQHLYPMP